MANTTNFGWETPDDTDLVKDGAAAIRTLGSAIDTSLADLEGGTTGQILAKNSNTDMDFIWVTNDVGDITEVVAGTGISGGGTSGSVTITNTVATEFDAKGDLVVGTGADTFDKLSAGTNDHRLVAASGETTGLKYVADTQNTVVDAEGDLLVGDSADTLQRLAIGSNTHVLTVDTAVDGKIKWAAASTGALTKITSASFSAQSSVSINGCFTSTYKNYLVTWVASSSVAAADLQLQFQYSTSTAETTEYYGSAFGYTRANSLITWGFTNASQGTIYNNLGDNAALPSFGQIYFNNLSDGSERPAYFGNAIGQDSQSNINYSGITAVARTYTGFRLKADSGTITGRYQVYGLAD